MKKMLRVLCAAAVCVAGALTGIPAAQAQTFTPPYASDFGNSGLEGWTVIDANGDGSTWVLQNGAPRATFSNVPMDDWLISPGLQLQGGMSYDLSFEARGATFWPERMEVKFGRGNAVADMTGTVMGPTDIDVDDYTPYSASFTADESGVYYIGFHGISDPDMFFLFVNNVQVAPGLAVILPGAPTNLTATPGANAALSCAVSLTAPAQALNGEPIDALTKVELMRDGELIHTFTSVTPGQALSYTDTPARGGTITYSAVAYSDSGAGEMAEVTVLVGFDCPQGVESVAITYTETPGVITVKWPAVTADAQGNALTEADVTYSLYLPDEDGEWTLLADGVTGAEHTFRAVADGDQEFVQIMVQAFTTGGSGETAISELMPVGTPYDGIRESFADVTLSYLWGLRVMNGGSMDVYDEYTSSVGHTSQDGDNGYLRVCTPSTDATVDFFTGLVALDTVNPTLTFHTLNLGTNGTDDTNTIAVSVKPIDTDAWTMVLDPTAVKEICEEKITTWGRCLVPLDEFAGRTVQLQFSVRGRKYEDTMIDNIVITGVPTADLAVMRVDAPTQVPGGTLYDVTVTVENTGATTAEGYVVEVRLVDGDNEMAVQTVEGPALARGASTKVTVPMPRMWYDETEAYHTFSVDVNLDGDEGAENNSGEFMLRSIGSNLPVATELSGTGSAELLTLTWKAPALEAMISEPVTEGFEGALGFDDTYPGWTFVDVDGLPVFTEETLPGIKKHVDKGAFWVWNNAVIDWDMPVHRANNGDCYLFAPGTHSKESDNWAISPELNGKSQIISFFAQSRMWTYPEKIAVYWSEGSTDPADFHLINGSEVSPVAPAWTEYLSHLPEGARRFAIRSYGQDTWALMLDDITYTPVDPADFEIEGYNVYSAQGKLNAELLTDATMQIANPQPDATYVVTVVYKDRGESAYSNEFAFSAGIGAVENDAVAGDAEIYTVSGVKVSGTPAPGVYILRRGDKAEKTVIR